MTENKRFTFTQDTLAKVNVFDSDGEFICCTLSVWADQLVDKLNNLHEENQSLKFDNKELIRFIKSKGYTLKDYIEFIGQFQSVGVNKEDWE